MAKQDIAMQVLQQVVKLPVVKVDREKFLVEKFSKELDRKDIATLLEQGPTSLLPQESLDRVAKSCIKDNVLLASGTSVLAGLPGGLAMAITIPTDIAQFYAFSLKLAQELPDLGLTSFKITGSTPAQARQEMTKAFNQGERDAFLISLKAGGVGLNLTGADTVILVDLWWNPAVEAQAIGRAHRMGQEQKVEVYRLITKGTIEEKIQELQEQKKHLVSQVLDGTESRASLSLAEIREILGISEAST